MNPEDRALLVEYVGKLMYLESGAHWQWANLPADTRAEWQRRASSVLRTSGLADCIGAIAAGAGERAALDRALLRATNSKLVLDPRYAQSESIGD